jgi:hypothetical protein
MSRSLTEFAGSCDPRRCASGPPSRHSAPSRTSRTPMSGRVDSRPPELSPRPAEPAPGTDPAAPRPAGWRAVRVRRRRPCAGGHIDPEDAPLVLLLLSRLPHERCDADQGTVLEGAEIEAALGRVAKSERYRFNWGRPMFLGGFTEGEGFGFERLQPNLPPGCGIAFAKGAYLHPFHSNGIAAAIHGRNDVSGRHGRCALQGPAIPIREGGSLGNLIPRHRIGVSAAKTMHGVRVLGL